MKHNLENRCMYKLQVEDKVLELDPNERKQVEFDSDEQKCHYECNGYNRDCYRYIPVNHIKNFYQVLDVKG